LSSRPGWSVVRSPSKERGKENPPGTGLLGLWILLLSLSVLFAASVVGYLAVRLRAPVWPPPGMPGLPPGLWASTAVLVACSVFLHRAVRSARTDRQDALRRSLAIAFALGILFLLLQAANWMQLIAREMTPRSGLYGFTFFVLTGLHAAHVIGGLISLAIVARRAFRGRYSSFFHSGVGYCALYWHFLDGVWIVLFVVLLLGS
jgi:cytochrome c oxidase subunit 3